MKVKQLIGLSIIFVSVLLFSFTSKEEMQLLKTQLRVTIVNDMGNPMEGVEVSLFENAKDYHASENSIKGGKTDKKGRVTFSELKDQVYWVHAVKDNMSNAGLGTQTDTLQAKRLNQATIVIQ